MKIAVVEWFPRACGVNDWAVHISHGLVDLSHSVERVTFSKSGRPLSPWGAKAAEWNIYRLRDAVDVLNKFDLVIVSDIICQAPEIWKARQREGLLPEYVDVLREMKTPWTTMIHGSYYQTKHDATVEVMAALPNFTGTVITTVVEDVRERFSKYNFNYISEPCLPYHWPKDLPAARRAGRERSLIITARIASNKGHDFLFDNLADLGGDLHVWGENPYGFPSLCWLQWERAKERGYDLLEPPVVYGKATHPNAVKFYTGRFVVRAGKNTYRYHGAYGFTADVPAPDWSPLLSVNLTSKAMRGHLEYTTLDAVAAGCVILAPRQALAAPASTELRYLTINPLDYTDKKENNRGQVLDTFHALLRLPVDELISLAEKTQWEVRDQHDAARIAKKFLDGIARYAIGKKSVSVNPVKQKEETMPVKKTDEKPFLIINTYGGSLLLGAKMAGVGVMASYEDCGFGQAYAQRNFSDVPMIANVAEWPRQDLSEKIVIAHPPCAAFSIQAKGSVLRGNKNRAARGEDNVDRFGLSSDHFKCTTVVADYALGQRCKALAIESVPGALEGAWKYHAETGARYGYHVYRILQNAATFGVPQWRPRYWTVYIRKDLGDKFYVWHKPCCVSISKLVESVSPGPADVVMDRYLDFQRKALLDKKLPAKQVEEFLSTPGMLITTLQRKLGLSFDEAAENYIVGSYDGSANGERRGPQVGCRFVSRTARVLDPDGCAGVILGDTWFIYKGRNLTPAEYRAVMGFPRDYRLDSTYRLYLSKGVVPAVAMWVIKLIKANLEDAIPAEAMALAVAPGETVSLNVTKETWRSLASGQTSLKYLTPNLVNVAAAGLPPAAPVTDPTPAPAAAPPAEQPPTKPRVKKEASPVKPSAPAEPLTGKKKRVECRYVLIGTFKRAEIEAAFASARTVLPPLKVIEAGPENGRVTLVAQYEPPNAGGNRTDVDRMVARVAKKLSATWIRT